MMDAVDRADAARLSMDDILSPQGWILLSFLMDPRTGLGRFRNFRISNYQLMMQLVDSCLDLSIDQILASPDVAERVALYREHAEPRRSGRSCAARPSTIGWSCSTCVTRRSSTPPTGSSCTP